MITPLDDEIPIDTKTLVQPPIVNITVRPSPPPYSNPNSDANAVVIPSESSISEAEWKAKLKKLEKKIRKYNWTKQGDEAIVLSMRDLAASHNDPQVQAYWNRRATEFERAPDSDKKAILMDIGRWLAILIAAPFAIVGAMLMGTGMLIKGAGSLLSGVGKLAK
ncbi:hypothetical protein B0H13DRAFT_2310936 [Mycena leptocephala]|nr:hypothetical protein B0H13DRAFT_2310936 [Mycena leptocephala]